MKRFALIIAVVAFVLTLGTVTASAQNGAFAPYATAGVSVQGGQLNYVGKTNPNFAFGGGLESSTKHLLLDANANYNTANNVVTNNGYTVDAQASGYLKLGDLLAGAGVNESITNLSRPLLRSCLSLRPTKGSIPTSASAGRLQSSVRLPLICFPARMPLPMNESVA